jgi:para-nitrobenzyl esterase
VGDGRFRRPRQPASWSDVRDALTLGRRSPQYQNAIVHEFGVMNPTEPSGEDCLCLNLWSADLNDARRPVMVWLHGGGYSAASGGWDCYDGANLAAKHDVVVVSINHRLNAFGYLHLAQLGNARFEEASNLGMHDIVLALTWVRDNIEQFGGDKDNVTIFGQSGGAGKVSTLLGMPDARGLFHKAIVQSGSAVRSLTPGQARDTAERFLATLDLTPRTAERIVELPYYALRNALGRGGFALAPVVDGISLPDHVFDPHASDVSADVPMLIGSTETEVTWSTSQQYDPLEGAALRDHVMEVLGSDGAEADRIIALYREGRPDASGLDLYLIIATDASNFRTGVDTQAERKAALGQAPIYKYYFDWYSPVRGGCLRAMHCMDIPFVFDNLELAKSVVGDPGAAQPLANRMAGAWAAFARTGTPAHRDLPAWPVYDNALRATMMLDLDSRVVDDPYGNEKSAIAEVANSEPSTSS